MEVNLVTKIVCQNHIECDFFALMLSISNDKPIFEDEVAGDLQASFLALEDIITPEELERIDKHSLYANWHLHGSAWSDNTEDIVACLSKARAVSIYAIVAGDDGWYELWINDSVGLKRYKDWRGKSLNQLCDGKSDLLKVLNNIHVDNCPQTLE